MFCYIGINHTMTCIAPCKPRFGGYSENMYKSAGWQTDANKNQDFCSVLMDQDYGKAVPYIGLFRDDALSEKAF
jgi:hypothetical protein